MEELSHLQVSNITLVSPCRPVLRPQMVWEFELLLLYFSWQFVLCLEDVAKV